MKSHSDLGLSEDLMYAIHSFCKGYMIHLLYLNDQEAILSILETNILCSIINSHPITLIRLVQPSSYI